MSAMIYLDMANNEKTKLNVATWRFSSI